MCFIKPVVYERLFSDDLDGFLKRYVREQRRDVIGYQYVILVDVQVLNLFSEREGIGNCRKLETSVYRKPTNTGLLLHRQSHVDKRYKKSLIKTMVNRAFRLSSTREASATECDRLKLMFANLKYPESLINSTISHYVTSVVSGGPDVPA